MIAGTQELRISSGRENQNSSSSVSPVEESMTSRDERSRHRRLRDADHNRTKQGSQNEYRREQALTERDRSQPEPYGQEDTKKKTGETATGLREATLPDERGSRSSARTDRFPFNHDLVFDSRKKHRGEKKRKSQQRRRRGSSSSEEGNGEPVSSNSYDDSRMSMRGERREKAKSWNKEDPGQGIRRRKTRREKAETATSTEHREKNSSLGRDSTSDERQNRDRTRRQALNTRTFDRTGRKRSPHSPRREHRRTYGFLSDSTSRNDSHSTDVARRVSRKMKNLVLFWKMRFGGADYLMRFIEEVEEQAGFHRVSNTDLLDGIGSLLTGNAKVWFRGCKHKLHTWDAFKTTIKEAFVAGDDDDTIFEKLKKLRQKNEESYMVFETRVDELIRRMVKPPDEERRIRILLDGMHIFYRERIRAKDVKSLIQLRNECRSLERDKFDFRKREKEERRVEVKRRKRC